MAGGADDFAELVGAGLGCVEGRGQRVALVAQALDAFAAGGGGGGAGQVGIAGGEPFDFLELDAVPGGIADDGVEAALGGVVLPVAPDAGEGSFPVEERFLVWLWILSWLEESGEGGVWLLPGLGAGADEPPSPQPSPSRGEGGRGGLFR